MHYINIVYASFLITECPIISMTNVIYWTGLFLE